jgi:hypothetical protein
MNRLRTVLSALGAVLLVLVSPADAVAWLRPARSRQTSEP